MDTSILEIARQLKLPDQHLHQHAIKSILTDSRSLLNAPDTLFIALHTRVGDGHFYIRELYDRGVRNFIVERMPDDMPNPNDANILKVDDTMMALRTIGQPASDYHGMTVAITGSQGKTSVKELMYMLLRHIGEVEVVASPRSYNSQIGVPLSLSTIEADTKIALIEAGISRYGEMKELARLIRPNMTVYTGVDSLTHSEGFESTQQKAQQKALLAVGATSIVYPLDDTVLHQALRSALTAPSQSVYTWSRHDRQADVFILSEKTNNNNTYITYSYKDQEYHLCLPYILHNKRDNAFTALTALLAMHYDPQQIHEALAYTQQVNTRMNVSEGVNGCTVVLDGYSCDLRSLPEALSFMQRQVSEGQSKTLILTAPEDNAQIPQILRMIATARPDRLITIDWNTEITMPPVERLEYYTDVADFLKHRSPSDFSNELILLKGSAGDDTPLIAQMLEARRHETQLEVNLGALRRNYSHYKRILPEGTMITAMVKASAYGTGSYEIARTLQDAGANYLAVAVLDEGMELRRKGITMPLMVMNPKTENYRSMFANSLEPEVYSQDMLYDVIAEAQRSDILCYPIHIKLDTGMHRTGFICSEIDEICRTLSAQHNVYVATVFSHLATADCVDMDYYTLEQIRCFEQMTQQMQQHLPYPFLRHILNSAGAVRFPQYAFDMARIGIGLYGVNTLPPPIQNDLEPVTSLSTMIISLREWDAGEAIGYGRKGILKRPARIATLPIGYADGMNRHFGNGNILVKVNGRQAPTIGNICMDACMIDVTGIECNVGDRVEIFGSSLPMERLSNLLETIPYEILTSISPRVKRVYYRD